MLSRSLRNHYSTEKYLKNTIPDKVTWSLTSGCQIKSGKVVMSMILLLVFYLTMVQVVYDDLTLGFEL